MDKKVTYKLVARYFSGNSSESERHQVENWRDSSTANLAEFNQFREIWENARQPEKLFTPNLDAALKTVNQKLPAVKASSKQGRIIKILSYSRQIAAAILVGVGIWFAYFYMHTNKEEPLLVIESGNFRNEIVLSDGTHIWLNANTSLRYPEKFKGTTRKVYIEGETYLDVAKNPNVPFVIETEQSLVTVVGTEFNLRARKNEVITSVTVTEGKVSFSGKNIQTIKPVYLMAGDKGLLNASKKEILLEKNQNPNFLAWKTGKLVFKNTPLDKVVADLSEYFNTSVMLHDSSKAKTPFTSTFNHQSLKDILTIMEMSLGVKADTTNKTVHLK